MFVDVVHVIPQLPADLGYRKQFSRDRALRRDTALKSLRVTTNFSMSSRRTDLSTGPTVTRVWQVSNRRPTP